MGAPILERFCIHTATTRPLPIEQVIDIYAAAGVRGITLWRDAYDRRDPVAVGDSVRAAGLQVVALCRGGFFVAPEEQQREAAIDENRVVMNEAALLGAPMVVLVCGADPGVALADARDQIRAGIEALLPLAEDLGVSLALEPLHPMYAADRSAINTMAAANDLCDGVDHPRLGVALDVYHTWWDSDLQHQIERCGSRIEAFHVCDWRVPTRDMLNDRGLMGEGCIPIRLIRGWAEDAGFTGFCEVEIFSDEYWLLDQEEYVTRIAEAYKYNV